MDLNRRALLLGGAFTALAGAIPRAMAAALGYPRALQGPMVGAPGPHHFTVWVRSSAEVEVALEFATDRYFAQVRQGTRVQATAANHGCVVLRAEGLQPDTEYWYRVRYDGGGDRYQPQPYRTRTAPAGPADFRVAFGSCCRIQTDPEQRIWDAVQSLGPDLFLWLGDNVYADSDSVGSLVDLYSHGRAVDRLVPLLRSTPHLATWDDHDFAFNDSDRHNPVRAQALQVFKAFWANPSYGVADNPGV